MVPTYFTTHFITMQPKFLFTLVAGVSFVLFSCKKDEKSKSDLLVDGGCWKHTKSEFFDSSSSTWENSPIDSCDLDDCLTLNVGGTITLDEGAFKCDPTDPQTSSGTWSLSTDETTLTLVDNAFPIPVASKIIELSADKMILETEFLGEKSRDTFQN